MYLTKQLVWNFSTHPELKLQLDLMETCCSFQTDIIILADSHMRVMQSLFNTKNSKLSSSGGDNQSVALKYV